MKKLSYEIVKDTISSYGYTLISESYKEAHTKLELICDRNHKCLMSYTNLKSGKRCKDCNLENKRNDIKDIAAVFSEYGYSLKNNSYSRSDIPIHVTCPNGHDWKVSLSNFREGRRCSGCEGNRKKTLEEVRQFLSEKDYELISTEYKGAQNVLHTKCPKGHDYHVSFSAFKNNQSRCTDCSGKRQKIYEEVRNYFESNSYKLVTDTYTKNDIKMHSICPAGHNYFVSYGAFNSGHRCPDCQGLKVNINQVKIIFDKENYVLLTNIYKNAKTKLKYICVNGHKHKTTWNDFQQGTRCPICSKVGISKMEKELFDTLSKNFIEINKKKFKVCLINKPHIKFFELDIFNKSTMSAIEFDGKYYHSEKHLIESKTKRKWSVEDAINYHEIKDSFFLNYHGIEVLHIKEEDWLENKGACIALAKSWLGSNCSIWPKKNLYKFN